MSNEALRETVLKWCQEEMMFREEIKDAGSAFHFRVCLPEMPGKNPLLLSVVQPEGKDKVIVTSAIGIDSESSAIMARMDRPDRERFVLDLCYKLHLGPALFHIEESEGIIKQVSVTEVIYSDGLSKDRFMRSTQNVYKGISVVILELRGILGRTAPGKEAAAPPVEETRRTLGSKR